MELDIVLLNALDMTAFGRSQKVNFVSRDFSKERYKIIRILERNIYEQNHRSYPIFPTYGLGQ